MSEITDFLLARIAEDEAVAQIVIRGAVGLHEGRLEVGEPWYCDEQSEHVALAPARVLAECEAKRRIVDDFMAQDPGSYAPGYAGRKSDMVFGQSIALERAVRSLALPYVDHPDFRPEWLS